MRQAEVAVASASQPQQETPVPSPGSVLGTEALREAGGIAHEMIEGEEAVAAAAENSDFGGAFGAD